ncbi:glycosyltransferase family 2 protein [Aureimonas glaciei]|uniref:glycosyltransferase family 2 protein n=1 Tax=Aureimonas glaciei TaxID=1776957 RepID=UPI00166E8A50|nr:glycosyltransferase family 2 protein [Aureimonas glaciei]
MANCSVIIPYYQKTPGILVRALNSVFAQSYQDFEIVIVDDASPLPVEAELGGFTAAQQSKIRILHQANMGPGGARNTGLAAITPGTQFAAFIDSDDEWTPDHLATAVRAMNRFDADCYFASITGGDAFYYHFDMAKLAETTEVVRLAEDPLILEVPDLSGAMLKNWSFMHLSCLVLGESLFRTARFEAEFRLAAEDVLFFYDCVRTARRTVLSGSTGAVRGEGLNIFHGVDNQSPEFLRQQYNTFVALDTLAKRFDHKPADLASLEGYRETARRQALWGQAGRVKRRKLPEFRLLAEWAWRDPKLLKSVASLAFSKFSR